MDETCILTILGEKGESILSFYVHGESIIRDEEDFIQGSDLR
jgi:hypothetical protein